MSRQPNTPKILATALLLALAATPALYSQYTTALQPDTATNPHRIHLSSQTATTRS